MCNRKKLACILIGLTASLLLSGCGWLDGRYASVTSHQSQRQNNQSEVISASSYGELIEALEKIVASGTEMAAINISEYPQQTVEQGMEQAVRHVMAFDPITAYAVKEINYELGTSVGQPAVAVSIQYLHGRTEIQGIRTARDVEAAKRIVTDAMAGFESGIVLLVEDYEPVDCTQLVQDYALENPQIVMETPQVTEAVYGSGISRVVELVFTYQNSRDSLRRMQSQVKPVFDAASLYVSGDDADRQKYAQLYAFLMERFDYKVETSITPAYSLLRHGVGDSRAFARVYAAMCRGAGLECLIVTGTHAGEPWTWNIVLDDGQYYHVDLLWCSANGGFRELSDTQMEDYVWDYSMYPACTAAGQDTAVESTQQTIETVAQTEETQEEK